MGTIAPTTQQTRRIVPPGSHGKRARHAPTIQFLFYTSIVTAVLFMVVAIILIWLSFDRQNPWTAASSLLSLIPVLATKLVYQQALQANERADQLF